MRITALYKTFDGHEWIEASLASIYSFVDSIIMVHSTISWLGESGNGLVEQKARLFPDPANKIRHITFNSTDQKQQYAEGLKYVPSDHIVMVVDSDEIWEQQYLESALRQVQNQPNHAVYRAEIHTYVKTPFYRIDPPYGKPTAFFRDPSHLTTSPRGCMAPGIVLSNVWFHHMTYVRQSEEETQAKIHRSCHADGNETIRPDWSIIWNNIPNGINLHPFTRHKALWHSIRKCWLDDLPAELRQYAEPYAPPGELMHGEELCLRDLAKGASIAIDLGTSQGRSALILSLGADRVYTVDLFEDVFNTSPDGDLALWHSRGHNRQVIQANLAKFGNITSIHDSTVSAATKFADSSVCLVFVDASHTYQAVEADYNAWWSKLKKNGVMVFHDYSECHPDVVRFIDQLTHRRKDLGPYCGSLRAIIKD